MLQIEHNSYIYRFTTTPSGISISEFDRYFDTCSGIAFFNKKNDGKITNNVAFYQIGGIQCEECGTLMITKMILSDISDENMEKLKRFNLEYMNTI
jgi:hypothetical protein